jgi:hypothetical protein
MNPGASEGRIPENVSVKDRASVTAGFANEVEAVNQYAAVMYDPTAKATVFERWRETSPDDGEKAEGCNEFTEKLRWTAANVL